MAMVSVVLPVRGRSSIWTRCLINFSLSKPRQLQAIQHCCCRNISYHNANATCRYLINGNKQTVSRLLKQQSFLECRQLFESNKCIGLSRCLPNATSTNCLTYTTCSRSLRNSNDNTYDKADPGRTGPSGSKDDFSSADGHRLLNEQKKKIKTMLDEAQSPPSQNSFDFGDAPQLREEEKKDQPAKIKIDPRDMSVLLFPGQGAQFVGMGKTLLDYPIVRDMYEVASTILGYDLLALCLNGPKEDLDRTVHCQPAVLVTSLAAVEKLKEENFKVG